MLENYEHYITDNIKGYYKKRISSPVIYLLILLLLWNVFSLSDLIAPTSLATDKTLESSYQ